MDASVGRGGRDDGRPRLVALDLDGTLLRSDKRLSARTVRAVQALAADGVRLMLCTGRPPRLTHAYARELGLESEAIVYNGASVVDFTRGRTTHLHQLDADGVHTAIARLRAAHPGVRLGIETAHGWYLDEELARARGDAPYPPDGVGRVEDFVRSAVIKLFARHPERDARALNSALGDLHVYATWSGEGLLEVMHPEVNKRAALKGVAERLGIGRERVAAFGDENNDREMLAWAGYGVAMANGSGEARAAAAEVTLSNDDDGVARVLERWLEGNGG